MRAILGEYTYLSCNHHTKKLGIYKTCQTFENQNKQFNVAVMWPKTMVQRKNQKEVKKENCQRCMLYIVMLADICFQFHHIF